MRRFLLCVRNSPQDVRHTTSPAIVLMPSPATIPRSMRWSLPIPKHCRMPPAPMPRLLRRAACCTACRSLSRTALPRRACFTTSGHPPLADYVPQEDADLVARLRAQGAVLIGKTNLPSLAGDIQCANPLFGRTNNPFDPALTSGGSSGGSAVAVAAGFSALDLGSDLGGSIRIPAAFCGVAGMKVTEGRWSLAGHIPPLPGKMRSVWHMLSPGLLARHIDDLRLGFAALDDKPCAPPALPASLRIAWCDDFAGIPLCRRTRSGLQQAVLRLQAQGHQLVRDRPVDFNLPEV